MTITRRLFLLLLALVLGACNYHLRGSNISGDQFPFKSLYVKGPEGFPFLGDLKRDLEINRIKLAATPEQADLVLEILSIQATKQILSLSGSGRVQEYQLLYRVSLRAYDKQKVDWLPVDDISMSRIMAYDDSQILAKEQEEALLYKDMRSDAVAQTVRRLSRAKPHPEQ
ncbi:MAG: LPS assembly lipoprotein LptE [Sideroxydans sp.]|nr:LPS assembly lipoprotein LptE [Sideroxydans sp.]